jgi:glyoxylase-like metal-dependent hydrolase (beta-lactamase superfamily II)
VPILFDTGFPDTTDVLVEGIEEAGLTSERVIIAHEDREHVGGLEAIVEEYDPETWAPADAFDAIVEAYGVEPDDRFEHGDWIGPDEAVHVPGHTPGCSVLVNEAEDSAVTPATCRSARPRGSCVTSARRSRSPSR